MPNPLVAQGVLNRLRASVVWTSFPGLNVTAPYLAKQGLRLALEGESTLYIPSMTGAVRSPEPYMMIGLTMALLKSQSLADYYKQKMESDSALGDGTVRPDSTPLSPYQIINCSIQSVREMDFAGEDASFAVTVKGYYNVNSTLFDF